MLAEEYIKTLEHLMLTVVISGACLYLASTPVMLVILSILALLNVAGFALINRVYIEYLENVDSLLRAVTVNVQGYSVPLMDCLNPKGGQDADAE